MLSWSIKESKAEVDLTPLRGGGGDPLIPAGEALLDYVNATLGSGDLTASRQRVTAQIGDAGVVDAAAVIGTFEMMNRIADGVGMPVGRGKRARMAPAIAALGLDEFPHA